MLVPNLLSVTEVIAQSNFNEEQVFDLGISEAIIFLVVVPEVGACRISSLALSHFMAGAEQYEAEAMPEYYSGSLSGKWNIKKDRLRILRDSWDTYPKEVFEFLEESDRQKLETKNRAEKRKAGRYTITEAVELIASSTGERPEEFTKKLSADVASGSLTAYEPNKKQKYRFGGASVVHDFYEEIYWNDLNIWLAKHEPKISFTFPNPEEYESLYVLIQPHLKYSWADLPELLRIRISEARWFGTFDWDSLTEAERNRFAHEHDLNNDPVLVEGQNYYFYEKDMDATYWWNLASITVAQAAMLFIGQNPLKTKEEVARGITTYETTPEDFKKLYTAFEALERANPQHRTLADWLNYAIEGKLKTHSWIARWKAFHLTISNDAYIFSEAKSNLLSTDTAEIILGNQENSTGIKNKLRKNTLDVPIDKAVKLAGSLDTNAVYLKLKELALGGELPFTGMIEGDSLCYTNDKDKPDKLSKASLGKRLSNRRP